MDNRLERFTVGSTQHASHFILTRLVPGEMIIYRAPRNWSRLAGITFSLLFALALGVVYVFLWIWQQNIIDLNQINMLATIDDAYMVQGIGWLRVGVLTLGLLILIFSLIQLSVWLGCDLSVTDHRVLGRVGRNILRQLDIPLDEIDWVDFPNHIFSKGPIQIHTRSRKSFTLWDLAKPSVFLDHLEARYLEVKRPAIHSKTVWGQVILALVGVAIIAASIYALYAAGSFNSWLNQSDDRQPAGFIETDTQDGLIPSPESIRPIATILPGVASTVTLPAPLTTSSLRPTSPRLTRTSTSQPGWVIDFSQPILDAIALRTPDFQDDFDDNSGAWHQPERNPCGYRVEILDGELVLTDCRAERTDMDYADFVVEFNARILPGSNSDSGWGFVFRLYDAPYTHIAVHYDGSISIIDLVNREHLEFPTVANPGIETNHLLVIAKGTQFAFYVNYEPFYYSESQSVSQLGDIWLLSTGVVAFDNFKIWDIWDIPNP